MAEWRDFWQDFWQFLGGEFWGKEEGREGRGSVDKGDLVSAKNRRESAKNLVFGRTVEFLAVFLADA